MTARTLQTDIQTPTSAPLFGRLLRTGAAAGVLAGIVFVIMLVVSAAMNEQNPFAPLGMFASLLLGRQAFTAPSSDALLVGTLVTVFLSTLYGTVFAFLNLRLSESRRIDWGFQAVLGGAYGAVLWLVNFQGFSRLLFPWLADAPQLVLLVSHVLFFGLPLGLLYAIFERSLSEDDSGSDTSQPSSSV
jgi:hypothetical protein